MRFPRVDEEVLDRLRGLCLGLPETEEDSSWTGRTFKIRRRIFAHVFAVETAPGHEVAMLVCRADPAERDVLLRTGHPFFATGSGPERLGVVLEDATDWDEVAELVTESYLRLAPKKLADLVAIPGGPGPGDAPGT